MDFPNKKNNYHKKGYGNAQLKGLDENSRHFETDIVCNIILKEILSISQGIISRKEYINKMLDLEKFKEAQKFTKNNCGSVLQTFYSNHECLSPKLSYEKCPNSPIKSPHTFLNYQQLAAQSEQIIKRQQWQRRRDSSKIYNCNKIFVLKNLKKSKNQVQLKPPSLKKIIESQILNQFTGRYSCKNEIKKIPLNQTFFVPKPSNRGRLTVNAYPASTRVSPKNTFFHNEQKNNSVILQQKKQQNTRNDEQNKLVKLQSNTRNSEQKSFKTIEYEKQTNNYITFLRDRKLKFQNIMKDFDKDEKIKKKDKIERDVILRQNKVQNLSEMFNKVPLVTTDYSGNKLRVIEPKILGQNNHQSSNNNASQTKLPKYQINNEGILSSSVGVKIKDIDEKTRNLLNQIFSSIRGTPKKTSKKIVFNETERPQKFNDKKIKKNASKVSLNIETSHMEKGKEQQQPSIKTFEFSKQKTLKNNNEKRQYPSINHTSKMNLTNIQFYKDSTNNKQNNADIDTQVFRQTFKDSKGYRSKANLRVSSTQREQKQPKPSMIQLGKLYRQQYNMKRDRSRPKPSVNQNQIQEKPHVSNELQTPQTQKMMMSTSENSKFPKILFDIFLNYDFQ